MPAKPTKNSRTFTVELPVDLLEAFSQFAESRGETKREVLIAALRRHMASPPPPPIVPALPPLPPMVFMPPGPVATFTEPQALRPAKRKGKK